RFELGTPSLRVKCSTAELFRPVGIFVALVPHCPVAILPRCSVASLLRCPSALRVLRAIAPPISCLAHPEPLIPSLSGLQISEKKNSHATISGKISQILFIFAQKLARK
ncbi:hypothetical protein, partial [uncultured Alistipes sp.]|uniref:hypothetical protein n=1 Tax=uncultured Alistipes sp. TaxID=538949 RepID=UPI0026205D5E